MKEDVTMVVVEHVKMDVWDARVHAKAHAKATVEVIALFHAKLCL